MKGVRGLLQKGQNATKLSEAQWGVLGSSDYTGAFQRSDHMGQESRQYVPSPCVGRGAASECWVSGRRAVPWKGWS